MRIAAIDPDSATGRAKELLSITKSQLGRIPNLYKAMANSPVALEGYLHFRAALGGGVLTQHMRERIALLTAAINQCSYCVSAHTFRGQKIGLSMEELTSTQLGKARDQKTSAALDMVSALMSNTGKLEDSLFEKVKAAGWSDEEIGEIVGHVALNVFSNFFNHVAEPELDFPSAQIER
jgi:uncharacterized peroxidase-related enzyme